MASVKVAPSLSQLKTLRGELELWLSELLPKQEWLVNMVLEPLNLVERLLPSVGKPNAMKREAAKVVEEYSRR
jgi:hypothetical protein